MAAAVAEARFHCPPRQPEAILKEVSLEATAVTAQPLARDENIPAGYSPGWHAARTLALALGICLVGVYLARGSAAGDWLFLPVFLVAFNALEWAVHGGPMHHPRTPRLLYHNHTLIHHRAFHHDQMAIADPRELGLIMMPWYTMLGLFVIASPVALAAGLLRGAGVAGVFYIAAVAYFLLYETLHALYHMPPALLRRLHLAGRLFTAMQAHHTHHHRLDRMTFVNFNVTFPLMDWLLGTKERDGDPVVPRRAFGPGTR
jgi:Fatty acid hydroxylase superfamily